MNEILAVKQREACRFCLALLWLQKVELHSSCPSYEFVKLFPGKIKRIKIRGGGAV
jgi:hypothetical protein